MVGENVKKKSMKVCHKFYFFSKTHQQIISGGWTGGWTGGKTVWFATKNQKNLTSEFGIKHNPIKYKIS